MKSTQLTEIIGLIENALFGLINPAFPVLSVNHIIR